MTFATIFALFLGKITGDQFLILASMTFAFYFTKPTKTQDDVAGK